MSVTRWSSRIGLLVLGLLCSSCARIEPLQESSCGNRVVEEGEECDTHAAWPGAVCRPPHQSEPQCVYACSADGADGVCPPGYFCNFENRCIGPDSVFRPTGALLGNNAALLAVPVSNFPAALVLGDDIGDGRRAPSAYDYVDFEHGVASPLEVGVELASPTLWHASGEDVAVEPVSAFVKTWLAFVGEQGIQALMRPEDYAPKLVTVALPAEPAPETPRELRVMSVLGSASARVLDGGKSLLELEGSADSLVFRRVDNPEPPLLDLSGTGKRLSDLQGSVVLANWDARPESPCREIIVPLQGLAYLIAFSPCAGSDWSSDEPAIAEIRLPEAEGSNFVAGPARALDVNSDGHLDVVFDSALGPHVAYGRGDGSFWSSPDSGGVAGIAAPFVLEFLDESGGAALPLDGADLNADGHIDYALPGGIALSQKESGKLFWAHQVSGWTEAKIDRQGARVVAASPQPGVEVLTYLASAEQFVRSRWATALPATHLALGDYDGDATTDVAFAQSTDDSASVWTVLGGPRHAGVPEKLADFAAVTQLETAYLDTALSVPDAVGDLVVSGRLPGRESETFSFLLGNANGHFASPLVLRQSDGGRPIPLAVAASAHATSPHFLGAVAADPSSHALRLWAFSPTAEVGPTSLVFSEPLSDLFQPVGERVDLRYGAQLATGDLDADGVSELVLAAPYESPRERSAIVVGRLEGGSITTGPPLELDGVADGFARLGLADVDGDGWADVLFRPSGADEPPLLIFWNDQSGHFSQDARAELRPEGGVTDFTCDAFGEKCSLLVAGPAEVFTLEARDRELGLTAIPGVSGGRSLAVFNFLDTRALLVGNTDAISFYRGGVERPGLATVSPAVVE